MKHFTDYRIRCAKCKTIPYIDEIIYHKYGFITYHCKCGVHYISLSCFMNNLCVKSNENFDSPEEFNYCYKHKEKVHKIEKDVNKYYEKYKKEFLKSEKDVLKIFEIDYYLWNKEKQS